MTGGSICYICLSDPPERVLRTQGQPSLSGDEVRMIGAEGREVGLDEVDELTVRGPYTIHDYYRLLERNAKASSVDGFYRIGDQISRGKNGYPVAEGHDKDQVDHGGERIVTEEVESLLIVRLQVHGAAVVTMPDSLLGEHTCVFVVLRQLAPSTLKLRQCLRACRLAALRMSNRIELVPVSPQAGIGKIDEKGLCERLRHKLEAHA